MIWREESNKSNLKPGSMTLQRSTNEFAAVDQRLKREETQSQFLRYQELIHGNESSARCRSITH